jgi:hypothetical protein
MHAREGSVRWEALARRRGPDAGDEARWNVALPAGRGRLVLASQLRLAPGPDARGWTDPLAVRRPPPAPSPSTSHTGAGASWARAEGGLLRLAVGRDAGGRAVAQAMAGARGWHAGAGVAEAEVTAALGWGGRAAGLAARVEGFGVALGALLRAALGDGAAGVLAESDARNPGARSRVLRAAARIPGGTLRGLRVEGAVRGGASRARPFEVAWARRGPGWAARVRVAGRATAGGAAWRLAAERDLPGSGVVAVTLDGDAGVRPDAVRWSWRVGGRGARAGASVDLPVGRSRSGAAFVDVPAGSGLRLVARGRWSAGRRAAFDLEWTAPLPGTGPHSTR